MKNFINKLCTKIGDILIRKKKWKPTSEEIDGIFGFLECSLGICNLKASSTNIIGKVIGFFSKYKENGKSASISHTVTVYHGDITKVLSGHDGETKILKKKLAKYYKNPPELNKIKTWVICSADQNGMNYFDFSEYQNREFSLIPIQSPDFNKKRSLILDLIRQYKRPYDYIGLIFWPFYKIFVFLVRFLDDRRSWFCSEVNAAKFKKHGIQLTSKDNPSPADIEYATDGLTDKYRTEGFLR